MKSKNEQENKISSSEIDISNIAEFNMSSNEKNMKDNLNGLNVDVIYFSDDKSSKYFPNNKNKENNEEKIVGSDNNKKKTDRAICPI